MARGCYCSLGIMDARGWVLRAVERLRFASVGDIQRWLDEEGESLSRLELARALEALLREGRIELERDVYRPARKSGGKDAFDQLFGD
ncbi:hypothetical protein Mrose_01535 [Calidithermus roseus]|uniref:Uncharacterized protein n=2 Tax=Calidithermus roseus TaxID=1644118 RepID=A0A399EQM8_9DEIN|nr:hypothetical protein Mrose_01535 [Calidithermus roseus]